MRLFERMTYAFRETKSASSTKRFMEDRTMELEIENSRLRRLVAELLLKNQQLRDGHLPNQRDSGKFDRDRSLPHPE